MVVVCRHNQQHLRHLVKVKHAQKRELERWHIWDGGYMVWWGGAWCHLVWPGMDLIWTCCHLVSGVKFAIWTIGGGPGCWYLVWRHLRPSPPSTATQYAALQPGSGGRGGRGSAGETSVTPAPPGGQYHQRQSHWHQSSIAIDHHQSKITSDTCTSTRVVSPLTINQVLRPVTTTKAESSMTPAAPERCHLFVEMPEVTLGRNPWD